MFFHRFVYWVTDPSSISDKEEICFDFRNTKQNCLKKWISMRLSVHKLVDKQRTSFYCPFSVLTRSDRHLSKPTVYRVDDYWKTTWNYTDRFSLIQVKELFLLSFKWQSKETSEWCHYFYYCCKVGIVNWVLGQK